MTFTFTMDALPDYTKYNRTKKVLCAIRVLEDRETEEEATTGSASGFYGLLPGDEPGDAGGSGYTAAGTTSKYSWKSTDTTE